MLNLTTQNGTTLSFLPLYTKGEFNSSGFLVIKGQKEYFFFALFQKKNSYNSCCSNYLNFQQMCTVYESGFRTFAKSVRLLVRAFNKNQEKEFGFRFGSLYVKKLEVQGFSSVLSLEINQLTPLKYPCTKQPILLIYEDPRPFKKKKDK